MADRTPGPWHVSPHSHAPIYIAAPDQGMTAFVGIVPTRMMTGRKDAVDRANAAFIVKAVNNHDALVKALQAASEYLESDAADGFRPTHSLRAEIDTAIRNALVSSLQESGE